MDEPESRLDCYRRNKRLCNLFKIYLLPREIRQARLYAVGHGLYEVFFLMEKVGRIFKYQVIIVMIFTTILKWRTKMNQDSLCSSCHGRRI